MNTKEVRAHRKEQTLFRKRTCIQLIPTDNKRVNRKKNKELRRKRSGRWWHIYTPKWIPGNNVKDPWCKIPKRRMV